MEIEAFTQPNKRIDTKERNNFRKGFSLDSSVLKENLDEDQYRSEVIFSSGFNLHTTVYSNLSK